MKPENKHAAPPSTHWPSFAPSPCDTADDTAGHAPMGAPVSGVSPALAAGLAAMAPRDDARLPTAHALDRQAVPHHYLESAHRTQDEFEAHDRHLRAASWGCAWRAGAWAAGRELVAQGTAVLASVWVRAKLESASAPVALVCGVGAALVVGMMVHRATELIAAVVRGPQRQGSASIRLAAGAAPIAALVTAGAVAAGAGTLAQANAYLVGKLLQRGLRDVCSNALTAVLPSSEIIDAQGMSVRREALAQTDWGRALTMTLPTTALFMLQDFMAPASAGCMEAFDIEGTLRYVLAMAGVEAARALNGTLATAALAHAQGMTLHSKPSGGWRQLAKNLSSGKTLQQASDAAAMRQYFGVWPDMIGVVAGRPQDLLRQAIFITLRSELKALSEFRAPMVTRGLMALERRDHPPAALRTQHPSPETEGVQLLSEGSGVAYPAHDPALQTLVRINCLAHSAPGPLPSAAPPAPGRPRFPGAPGIPTSVPRA